MTIEVRDVGAGESTVTVADRAAALTAGTGCSSDPSGEVECSVEGLYIVFAYLEAGDDSLSVDNLDPGAQLTIGAGEGADSVAVGPDGEVCIDGGPGADELAITTPSQACIVEGGGGDDTLTGSNGYDRLYGGDGRDVVVGGGGSDYVYGDDGVDTVRGGAGDEVRVMGGAGDDRLEGNAGDDYLGEDPGDDRYDGGPGLDTFDSSFFFGSGDDTYVGGPDRDRFIYFCPSCRVTLDGLANDGRADRGETDNVDAEWIATPSRIPPDPDEGDPGQNFGSGEDVLVGDTADNVLVSYRGDDRLDGAGGRDRLRAHGGDDRVMAADGVADLDVDCGPGNDTAIVDSLDRPVGCEHVTVGSPPPR